MAYLLDTSVFISASNLHYGFDFCPAFWDWLIVQNSERKVFSIERVSDKIDAMSDALSEWAKQLADGFFFKPDNDTLPAFSEVGDWIQNSQRYEPIAIKTFLQKADYYLTAQAKQGVHTVVTHEVSSISSKKVKIPDVCIGIGIKCVTPYEMLRIEKARFILSKN